MFATREPCKGLGSTYGPLDVLHLSQFCTQLLAPTYIVFQQKHLQSNDEVYSIAWWPCPSCNFYENKCNVRNIISWSYSASFCLNGLCNTPLSRPFGHIVISTSDDCWVKLSDHGVGYCFIIQLYILYYCSLLCINYLSVLHLFEADSVQHIVCICLHIFCTMIVFLLLNFLSHSSFDLSGWLWRSLQTTEYEMVS